MSKEIKGDWFTISINNLQEMMNYLIDNNTGRDIDIMTIRNFITLYSKLGYSDIIEAIATKSLKLGVSADTWNKLVPKEHKLPVFDVMLAEKYFDHEDKIKGDFIITTKLDGNRSVIFNETSDTTMRTRQGQLYEGFVDIEEEFKLLPKGYVFDGEFIAVNEKDLDSADLYRETTSKVRKDGIKKGVVFHAFDVIPVEDFKNGISHISCQERKELLHKMLSEHSFKWIKEVPILYQGSDKSQVIYWLDKLTSEGLEGVMVNLADAPYECKRTRSILKVKKMQSADLEIVSFEEGDGRLKSTLGRMNVLYKGCLVGVGSGFSDSDREYIWNNQDNLVGRVAEIQYFEESTNKKDGNSVSLRFPVFKCIREEGKEVSYF